MIHEDVVDAYNNRLTADLNNIKTMTAAQLDRVKTVGSAAENLLKNKDFAQFVHQFKFERIDVLVDIGGHADVDNAQRVAVANQLSGIDEFVRTLKRAVYIKNRVVSLQSEKLQTQDPQT
jgi:copper homeostasis protein CutC